MLSLGLMIFYGGEVKGQCVQIENNGSNTFIVPAEVSSITVEAWGAGGRGGTRSTNGESGGGGGGSYSVSVLTVTPGQSYTYVVGNGSTNTSPGGNSRFYFTSVPGTDLVRAIGGNSVGNNSTAGALGGGLGIGTIRYAGGRGANGGSDGGGGGSSAGTGQNGNYTTSTANSNGANAPEAGGNGGDGADNNNNGIDGPTFGGGGGGGKRYSFWFWSTTRSPGDGADGQIKISYTPTLTSGSPSASVPACVGNATTSINRTTSGVTGVSAYSGLPAGVTPTLTGNILTISGTPTNQATGSPVNYSITLTGACGATLIVTGTTTVNPSPTPTFTAQPATATPFCINDQTTYTTQSGVSAYTWGIPGVSGTDYQIVSGAGTRSITIRWLTSGSKAVTINYTNSNGCRTVTDFSSNSITISPDPSAIPEPASATACLDTSNGNIITQATTGVTTIGTATGLPLGTNATLSGNTIIISGTPTQVGIFNYSIPLNGTCGTATATGSITVEDCACQDNIFTTPGAGSIPIPTGVTSITVEVWGAGGRGTSHGVTSNGRGGGGGGAYSRSVLSVTPLTSYNYFVGTGSTSDSQGGNSWFSLTNQASSLVLAEGGQSAPTDESGNVRLGTGGQAGNGIGTVKFNGGNGVDRGNGLNGGGGSSAGTGANGNSPPDNAGRNPGATAPTGGGDGGNGGPEINSSSNGLPGVSPGGGGGGARGDNGNGATGGAGADGQVIITFTLSAGTLYGDQTICVSETTPFSTDLPGGGGTWSSSNTSIATVTNAGVVEGIGAGTAIIYYTISSSCATAQATRTVTVSAPLPAGTLTGIQEICEGGTTTFSSNSSNGTWTSSNQAVATVHPNTGLVTGIANGTATISYTLPQSGICPPIPGTRTITVTAPPIPGTLSGEQAICVAGTSTFSSTQSGGVWTSSNPSIATINSTTGLVKGVNPGPATMTYTVAGTGGCKEVTATRVVIITAIPTAGTLNGNQEVCVGETPTFSSSIPGGTWVSSDPSVATIDSSSGLVTTIDDGMATDDRTATMTYTVTGTGGCANATATRDITVHALPEPTITGPAKTNVCIDEQVTYSTDSGMDFYFWIFPGVINVDYEIISGGTDSDNTVTLVWKTVESKSVGINYADTNGCPAPAEAYSTAITVDPDSSIDSESLAGQIICDGDTFNQISISASGPGTLEYQWYKNTTNSTTGGTPVGTDSDSYLPLQSDFAAIGDGSPLYYYVVVSATGGCGVPVTSAISGAFVVKELVQITDHPDITGGVQCFGDGFSSISVIATGSNLTYQWYRNTDQSNTGGTLITGATNPSFTPPSATTLNVTYYYYVVVTGYCLPGVPSDASGGYLVTPPFTLITLDLDSNAGDEERCIGDDTFPELEVSATGEINGLPLVNYQWYSSATPTNTGGTAIPGETGNKFTPKANVAGTLYYYAEASSDCGTVPSAISGAFIVNPETKIEVENLEAQAICEGDVFDPISVIANSGFPDYQASLTYQWYSNTVSVYTGAGLVEISGETDASFTPPSNVIGSTLHYFVEVSGTCGPDVNSSISGAFYITPNQTVGPASSDPEQCVDLAIPNITHTTTYASGIGAPSNLPTGVTASFNVVTQTITIAGTPTASGTFNYSVPVLGCEDPGVNATGTITVNPKVEITTPIQSAVCSDDEFTVTPTDVTDGEVPAGTTYSWSAPTVTGGLTGGVASTGSPTSITGTLINPTNTAQTATYIVTPTSGTCIGANFTVIVTVNPKPAISPNPFPASICSDGTFKVLPVDGTNGIVPTNTTYTWSVAANSNVTGQSTVNTAQSEISQTLTNTGTAIETVTYTVTPKSGSCDGDDFTVTVTVKPTPTVNSITSPLPVCNGSATSPINFTGNSVAGIVYNWTNDTPSIGLGDPVTGKGTGNIPSFTATNPTENDLEATITVTPSANGCDGPSQTFTITVRPPVIKSLLTDYCAPGGEVGLIASENKAGTTWLWNTGETTSSISVKIAGTYSVTATSPDGCVQTRFISIAQELVINGDFTNGNTVDPAGITGFATGYTYTADIAGTTELNPEGRYGIGADAHNYHENFWGLDHTSNTVGARNMMIVNGYPGSNSTIIWEQEVTVKSGVEYYFSAFAMSLNKVNPFAKLQFEVNGGQVGTIANLQAGVENNSNGGWEEFYGIWPSTVDGTIKIRIINKESSPGGNDFALDDLSFGTLSTFVTLTSAVDTDDQVVCQDSPIGEISYSIGSGIAGPVVTNLPPGVTTTWNGVTLLFSGSPTTAGDYTYTITTTGTCSTASATGRIVVRGTPQAGEIEEDQTVCEGEVPAEITSKSDGTGDTGSTIDYRWESNTDLNTPSWTEIVGEEDATYNPSVLTETTQYRRITIATLDGLSCESAATEEIQVTVQGPVTEGAIEAAQTICYKGDPAELTSTSDGTGDGTITYLWEYLDSTTPDWTTISGVETATYDPPAELTETTQYRRTTISTINSVECESPPTAPVVVNVNPAPTITPSIPQELCVNTALTPMTLTTTGTLAPHILQESSTVDYNLPNGVTASWNAGVLTISGTPTEIGVFNYTIPLIPLSGCGLVNAVGTITVMSPSYPITRIDVVNPASVPGISTFTVFSPGFEAGGKYTLTYSTAGVNQGANQTIIAIATAGQLSFPTLSYDLEGTTQLTILSIQEELDKCPYYPQSDNTAPYGVNCSSVFTGNATFYVPANVSQVTIQAFGDPSDVNPDTKTMSVLPSGTIFIVFDGTDLFATEVPASATNQERRDGAIVFATGPNGRIVFNYDCNPSACVTVIDNGSQYTDSDGYTVVKFNVGDACAWYAPDGLDEFEVLVVGGGGGGGFGNVAGGGGGGAVIYQKYTDIKMNNLPGLQGAVFPLVVGNLGSGGTVDIKGKSGFESTFSLNGTPFNYSGGPFTKLTAQGGGGGGSTSTDPNIRTGSSGASGGGGAAYGIDWSYGGSGILDYGGGNASAAAGGGGGGAEQIGVNGSSLAGTMIGGNGGEGRMRNISGEEIYYGAGGGGTSSGGIINQSGNGGSAYGASYFAGGNGINNGSGQFATTPGSGGGAGRDRGGDGAPGIIYIRYPNFRILPVEYLYFNAKYNSILRSGDLTWATAKEWENDHFEIERSVNNVKEWETIGEIAGAGYSQKEVKYDYTDLKLPVAGGNIFYRLKQYDFDGDFIYSDTKSIKVERLAGVTHWKVFPNPTTGDPFNIEILGLSAYHDEPISLRIISASGQYETIQVSELKKMGAQVSDWFTTKAAGIYIIEISWNDQLEHHKVILRR